MYCGVDWDIARWTIEPPLRDDDVPHTRRFGSSHARACGMAFCDGHVETVSFEIDPDVHRRYGNRSDSVR
jgi:prepilin-type processing-associated H-X9-DG protein